MNLSKKYEAKLISNSVKTPTVKTFVFSVDQEFNFIPGQYIFLEIPGFEIKRPFSILDFNKQEKTLSLGIKRNGEFTGKLWDLEIGSKLFFTGPFGRFCCNSEKTVFIAGGIGITPIYNMIINRDSKNDFLFYSSKSETEMPYLDEVLNLKNVNKTLFFTREKCDKGLNCRVSASYILKNLDDWKYYDFFICGPKIMIDSLKVDFLNLGVSKEKIRSEVF
ncbi:FAD-dependent oxidoreductase [Candidatus Woesearchaeota archaeon]|nr:FAD-dependent oxidoreductase [Candidatus Woesearchaeota archaeon]MCF7901557.1 FAD-dependent oxidoreductase [Candidatus Woesearchaeota archaeon]MCF8013331.1 FAD-dependent oxidoreductase [Candidatus Woesearchaeota archaeon]